MIKFLVSICIIILSLNINCLAEEKNSFDEDLLNEYQVKEVFDPLNGYNRIMTDFNDNVYTYAIDPIASGYAYVIPQTVRLGISNMFDNILFPVRFFNNILQFKIQNSIDELGRFIVNSTGGLLGFFDVGESYFGIKAHKEDLGQTLGYWGVGSGFHIVLPFLGPSNLRDFVGSVGDGFVDPTNHLAPEEYSIAPNFQYTIGYKSLDILNDTSLNLKAYKDLKKDAIDLYPFLRDVYEQRRIKQIKE